MRILITVIEIAIITMGLMQKCKGRVPMFDVGVITTPSEKIIVKKNSGTVIIIPEDTPIVINNDTIAHKTFLGDTLYLHIINYQSDTLK